MSVSQQASLNALNGQQRPNLRRKKKGAQWVGRPAGILCLEATTEGKLGLVHIQRAGGESSRF